MEEPHQLMGRARSSVAGVGDLGPDAAALTASERVGPAIVASALALVAGLLVLGASPVPMVRGFGLGCGLDLALATGAVLVLLPPMARSWLR